MPKFLLQTEKALVKKKRRWKPKGRQVDDKSFQEIAALLDNEAIVRDEKNRNRSFISFKIS